MPGQEVGHTIQAISSEIEEIILAVAYVGKTDTMFSFLKHGAISKILVNLGYPTRPDALRDFLDYGTAVRYYRGNFHCKLYIFKLHEGNVNLLFGSSNLTKSGIGESTDKIKPNLEFNMYLRGKGSDKEIVHCIDIFNQMWKKAEDLTYEQLEKYQREFDEINKASNRTSVKKASKEVDYIISHLPESGITQYVKDYHRFLNNYRSLALLYESFGRGNKKTPLYLEVDGFLNWLYHEKEISKHSAVRKLSPKIRKNEVRKWSRMYHKECNVKEDGKWRVNNSKKISKLLSKSAIDTITKHQIEEVIDRLNCTLAINKKRFLNNNSVSSIKRCWKDLLYGNGSVQTRINKCLSGKLSWFGPSGTQELLGFIFPNRYPIRNSLADDGLRFFGYSI